ncbi:MAG: DUF2937 family protein [Pseudomonadota bacterium]
MFARPFLLAAGVAGALAAAQFPGFSQQYVQRLGGAVDALSAEAQAFDASASDAGLTREEALDRYALSDDPFLVARGEDMAGLLTRFENLRDSLAALQFAGPVERLMQVHRLSDIEVAANTWNSYEPTVPMTFTGLIFAASGFGAGYGGATILMGLIGLPFRRRQSA